MFQRIPWSVWVPVVLVLLGGSILGLTWHRRSTQIADLQAAVLAERALRDTAQVKEAAARADRDTYAALYAAAKQAGGKPVAGVVIRVPVRDTLVIHDTVETVVSPDSTRVSRFRDSTFAGTIQGVVTAPPCCAPLAVTYTLTRPAFSPTIGFVRSGSRVLAMVEWGGEQVSVDAPFYTPPALPRWERWVDVLGDPDAVSVRLGTSVRVYRGWNVQAVADRRFAPNTPANVQVGVRYRW